MKKRILIVTLMTMTMINAMSATINWTLAGGTVAGNDAFKMHGKDGAVVANAQVYLILAGASDLASITDAADSVTFWDNLTAITLATATGQENGIKQTGIDNTAIENDILSIGIQSVALLFVETDSSGNIFYKYISGNATGYNAATTEPADIPPQVSLSWATLGQSSQTWYTGYAVPEPATAMLALAGVALLIRRRK